MTAKEILKTYIKEKYGKLFFFYYFIPGILSLLAAGTVSRIIIYAMALLTAEQAANWFSRTEINCLNLGYASFRRRQTGYILMVSVSLSLPWLVFDVIKKIILSAVSWQVVFYVISGWLFFVVIGDIIGLLSRNEMFSYLIIILLIFWLFQRTLVHELYFRYVSPVLLFDIQVNPFTVIGIILTIIFGALFIYMRAPKKRVGIAVLFVFALAAVTIGETSLEKKIDLAERAVMEGDGYELEYNEYIEADYAWHLAELLHESDEILQSYGFDMQTDRYEINASIYFPWESSSEKIFISRQKNTCVVNCYAQVMRELSDTEIITRYLYAVVKPETAYQEVVLDMLALDVPSEVIYGDKADELVQFSYDYLVDTYGSLVSPKQCVAAECMLNAGDELFRLYEKLGEISDLSQLDVGIFSSDEFKNVLRRIIANE